MDDYILKINDLVTGYGKKQIVNGVSLQLKPSEIVALIGHNGAGKSTILKAIFGLIPVWKGQIFYNNNQIEKLSPKEKLQMGMVMVPQGNRVFTELTVQDNLEMGGFSLKSKKDFNSRIDYTFQFFPDLKKLYKRNAGLLSGGEQQMLALANALILSPKILLLDEPSLGLAPSLVKQTFEKIQHISKETNCSILIIEQKVKQVLHIAHRAYLLKMGKVQLEDSAENLLKDNLIQKVYLS